MLEVPEVFRRLLASGGSDEPVPYMNVIQSWPCGVLFLGFVFVDLIWHFTTALLSYVTLRYTGRKALWLDRLKAEILSLGVITLLLLAIQSQLMNICIDGNPLGYPWPPPYVKKYPYPSPPTKAPYPSPPAAARRHLMAATGAVDCGYNRTLLFPYELIHYTHYLLFMVAVTHVVTTSISFYTTLFAMGYWTKWEERARKGYSVELEEAELIKDLGGNKFTHFLRCCWRVMWNSVNEPMYNLVRILFKIRIDSKAKRDEDKLPMNFNFLHMVESNMDMQFAEAGHWSPFMYLFTCIFLVIPQEAKPIYFLTLLGMLMMLAVAFKYQSILVQMGATSLYDFYYEVRKLQYDEDQDVDQEMDIVNQHDVKLDVNPALAVSMKSAAPSMRKALPSSLEAIKHRVRVHLKEGAAPDKKLHFNFNHLFWMNSPALLLATFQLSCMLLVLAGTLLLFGVIIEGPDYPERENVALFTVTVIVDFLMLLYAAFFIQPIAALVATVGAVNLSHMIQEIKLAKLVGEEDWEEGFAGILIKCFFEAKAGHHEHEHEVDEDAALFIAMLADQAGVIEAAHSRSAHSNVAQSAALELYKRFAAMWIQRARDWKNGTTKQGGYDVSCNMNMLRKVFDKIDSNHSGNITTNELADSLKQQGTRVTKQEVQEMVREIDQDGTDKIEFNEFCIFICFRFFNLDQDNNLDANDVQSTLNRIQLADSPTLGSELLKYCVAMRKNKEDKRRNLHLSDFMVTFGSTQFINTANIVSKEDPEHGAHAHH